MKELKVLPGGIERSFLFYDVEVLSGCTGFEDCRRLLFVSILFGGFVLDFSGSVVLWVLGGSSLRDWKCWAG